MSFGRNWGTPLRVTDDQLKTMSKAAGALYNLHPGLFELLRRRVVDKPMGAAVSVKCADAAWIHEVVDVVLAERPGADPLDSIVAALNRPESMLRDVAPLTAGSAGLSRDAQVTALRCDGPGCAKTAPAAAPFAACARCKMARYCSRDCQAAGWPEHKRKCAEQAAGRAADKTTRLSFDAPTPAASAAPGRMASEESKEALTAITRRVYNAAVNTLSGELLLLGRAWYEALGRGVVVVMTTALAAFAFKDKPYGRYLVVAYLTEADLRSDARRDSVCGTALPGKPRPRVAFGYEALRAVLQRNAGLAGSYNPDKEVVVIGGDGMWGSGMKLQLPDLRASGPVRRSGGDALATLAGLAYAHRHGNLLRECPSVLLYDMRGEQPFRRISMRWIDPAKPDPMCVIRGMSVPGVGDIPISDSRATPAMALKALDMTFAALAGAAPGRGGKGNGKRGGKVKGKGGAAKTAHGGAGGAAGAGSGAAEASGASGASTDDEDSGDDGAGDVD